MPFIYRNAEGGIVSVTQEADAHHSEYLKPTEPELIAFFSDNQKIDQTKSALAESDHDLARVTEDLIQLLVQKNIILFTELPKPVQEKLLNRAKLRSNLNGASHNFLDDDELI